ncbi:riboflavin synthase [Romboutsia maritimum]|uniref:Riboflavin synthase n=1 Tax=Romboutsia maritimum TaxID=2020948 RepID=A0A371ITC2_9FIRM|nr:riboflavin synthase [Romboutsia maritimum]RDY23748.1 riboflavin synthase [Romboutsia maritimum]
MFTGIIEEIGIVKKITATKKSGEITICAKKILDDLNLGDSVSINGVCLTVNDIKSSEFTADIMMSTIKCTNLGNLNPNDNVNLERAMRLSSRFGGHIVTGHVDTTGIITNIEKVENSILLTIKTNNTFFENLILKGSITIDGISLTICFMDKTCFKVSIIPHTRENTTLASKKIGSVVNLEGDIVGKYIKNFLNFENSKSIISSNINKDFLFENGFN